MASATTPTVNTPSPSDPPTVCEVVGGAVTPPAETPPARRRRSPQSQSTDDGDEGTKNIRRKINEWNKKNNYKPMTSERFSELVVEMAEFLEEKAKIKNCEDKENGGRFQQCSCLSIIRDGSNRWAVACFCVHFLQRKRNDQNQTVMDWYRYAQANRVKNKQWYLMPYDVSDCENADVVADALGSHKICRSAMMTLVQFGKRRMKSIKNAVTGNGVAQEHGNTGKRKRLPESDPKMIEVRQHFATLISLADDAPRATRIIFKKVELYTKYLRGGIVPLEFKNDQLYQQPTDEEIRAVKEEKKERKKDFQR